jgi:acyl-CoA thioester hydrolase
MFSHEIQIRVRYAETDQMGVVYHSNFFPWFESGRAEAIRSLGYTYADMERMGIIMPVVDVHCHYLRPAKYDELLTVRTTIKELPIHHKIEFFNDVYNEQNELLASAKIILYFMEAKTMKRTTMPAVMLETIKPYFNHS